MTEQPIQIGQPAPDFELQTFNGQNIRLSDLKGKVVVLNFWASWCKPCKKELNEFLRTFSGKTLSTVCHA